MTSPHHPAHLKAPTPWTRCLRGAAVVVFCLVVSSAVHAAELETEFTRDIQPLLQKYCFGCHSAEELSGDVDLSTYTTLGSIQADFPFWQTVLQQVRDEEMPPESPLPNEDERLRITRWIEQAIESIDWSQHTAIGHVTLPRLTKLEYNNTMRDLLGVDMRPGDLLLDDGQGLSGFTNDRDALFISPALAEQYFDAAEFALQAVINLTATPIRTEFEAENMLMTERSSKPQELPGGGTGYSLAGAGQRTLFDEVTLPADGWYRFTVRDVGIGGDALMKLRIDNEPRHDFHCLDSQPQEHTVELLLQAGTHQMTWNIDAVRTNRLAVGRKNQKQSRNKNAKPLPKNAGELVTAACATNTPVMPLPADAEAQVRSLVARLNANLVGMQRRIEYLRLITPEGNVSELRSYYNLLPERTELMAATKLELATAMNVTPEEIDRQLLEANRDRFESNQRVLKDSLQALGVEYDPSFLLGNVGGKPRTTAKRIGAPGVDWIRVEGPLAPQGSHTDRLKALFHDDADTALREFLTRAFRRPLRNGELQRYRRLYTKATDAGESHDQALKLAFTAALTSPSFLFRDEANVTDAPLELNAHQLASRLSYFLWMSMPDDELRRLADSGELLSETVLRAQVQRMLQDAKSRSFVESFMSEWLGFAGIGTEHIPDAKKFTIFSTELAEAMKLEPVLVFEGLLRGNGRLDELLDGRQTYVNEPLAAVYGIDTVKGTSMQPVLLDDPNRGGLLGMAAVLTASSTPNRTSPVLRGKWVLENLLGRELPEPPADAGQLDDKAGERGKTLREELALHRRDESCAVCHNKIDPIGFGLENFDAIGRFRTQEAGRPVDASGTLPGGFSFTGPQELRALIQTRYRDEFTTNVVRQLTAFALGRALRREDEGSIRNIETQFKAADNRLPALIEAIVLSPEFRNQGIAPE